MKVSLTNNSGAPLQFGPRTNAGRFLSGRQATQPPRSSTSHLTSTESVRQVSALLTGAETRTTTRICSILRCDAPKAWSIGMWCPRSTHIVPDYTDVLSDPFPSTSRLLALFDLQNQHPGLLERVKKHLVLPPCLSEDKLKTLWKCRGGNDCSLYGLKLNRAVSQVRLNGVMEYIDQGKTRWNRQGTTGEVGEDRFDEYFTLFGGDCPLRFQRPVNLGQHGLLPALLP